jgi:2-polyprenyl-3-methyl-5-hydroxy-6-metoxy-1,4-benzoquinol methylase
MEFTGERFIPGVADPRLALEHYHRYLFASRFVKGKRVLDVACGEGYGAAFLSMSAKRVVGIDRDQKTIESARHTYGKLSSLEFVTGACEALPIEPASFDVVVCFETLEHLDEPDQKRFLASVQRALSPGGICVVSTPDTAVYADSRSSKNEFHKHELTAEEFQSFLRKFFSNVVMIGQRVLDVSGMWALETWENEQFRFYQREGLFALPPQSHQFARPEYLIAVCSSVPSTAEALSQANSFYFDTKEIIHREEMRAWALSLNAENERLKKLVAEVQAEFNERSTWALSLNAENERLKKLLAEVQAGFNERSAWAQTLDAETKSLKAAVTSAQAESESRLEWATKLEIEVKAARQRIVELQREVEEKGRWARSLDDAHIQLSEQFKTLQRELSDRSTWVNSLQADLERSDAALKGLRTEFESRSSWALSLAEELKRERLRADEMKAKVDEATASSIITERRASEMRIWSELVEGQLHSITSSGIYRLLAAIGLLPKYGPKQPGRNEP